MLTRSRLIERLEYNPDTGALIWRDCSVEERKSQGAINRWNKRFSGKQAGNTVFGYLLVSIDGNQYSAHRLAWLYVYGEFPQQEIDHIDGDRKNNRIDNLRDVSRLENSRNRKLNRNSKTGVNGVCWKADHKKWLAHINNKGRRVFLGYFGEFEDAVQARKDADIKYEFHENHGRS